MNTAMIKCYLKSFALAAVIFILVLVALGEVLLRSGLITDMMEIFAAMINGGILCQMAVFFIAELIAIAFAAALWALAHWSTGIFFRDEMVSIEQ